MSRAYPGATQTQLERVRGLLQDRCGRCAPASPWAASTCAETPPTRKLTGAYDYVTNAGKTERQPLNIQASFRHDAGGWKLTSVRLSSVAFALRREARTRTRAPSCSVTFARRPPRFIGTSAFVTSVKPLGSVNLNPNDPFTMSSAMSGIDVGSIVRLNG